MRDLIRLFAINIPIMLNFLGAHLYQSAGGKFSVVEFGVMAVATGLLTLWVEIKTHAWVQKHESAESPQLNS